MNNQHNNFFQIDTEIHEFQPIDTHVNDEYTYSHETIFTQEENRFNQDMIKYRQKLEKYYDMCWFIRLFHKKPKRPDVKDYCLF